MAPNMKEPHGVKDTKCLRRYHALLVTGAARIWLARCDFLLVFCTDCKWTLGLGGSIKSTET